MALSLLNSSSLEQLAFKGLTMLPSSRRQTTGRVVYLVTLAWPLPWPHYLDTRPWPRYYEDVPAYILKFKFRNEGQDIQKLDSPNRTDTHRRDNRPHSRIKGLCLRNMSDFADGQRFSEAPFPDIFDGQWRRQNFAPGGHRRVAHGFRSSWWQSYPEVKAIWR